jgi:glycosyltransferase involved in cell wall biosynthesis
MSEITARARIDHSAGTLVAPRAAQIGVLHVLITLTPGGGERAAIEIARRLSSRFRTVACCLDEPGPWAGQLTQHDIPVVALHRRPGFHPGLGLRIARMAKAYDIDVLHCHQYSPYVYGSIAALFRPSLKVVVTEQGRLSDAPPSKKRRLANRFLGRVPSRVFAVSGDLREHMIDEGFLAHRVEVLHNSIEPGPFVTADDRAAARAVLGIPASAHVVGTVARFDPVKDLGTLVRGFATLRETRPEATLVMIGDGPEMPALRQLIAQLNLTGSTRLPGHRDDARRLMTGFDQYVNCSITEGTSLTIMEAMAASLPVVATAVGGTGEIVVDGETGVLVPSQDPRALSAALLDLATNETRAAALARAGRRRVEEYFSLDRMVERYARAYTD